MKTVNRTIAYRLEDREIKPQRNLNTDLNTYNELSGNLGKRKREY